MNSFISAAADGVLSAVFPENMYCIACEDTIDGRTRVHGLCDSCLEKIDWFTDNPYEEVMDGFAFDDLWCCCRYGFYVRRIMNGLKIGARTYYAKNIGLLLSERILEGCQLSGIESFFFDAVVPVPMYRDKLKARGYNQAELLAKECCRELSMPFRPEILEKTKATASMRFSDGRTRRTALSDVFRVPEKAGVLNGMNVLLVDDVSTTGSTADACSRVLKDAGAASVTVLVFAAGGQVGSDIK